MSESALIDQRWIARDAERASTSRFILWLTPWVLLLLLGIYAAAFAFITA